MEEPVCDKCGAYVRFAGATAEAELDNMRVEIERLRKDCEHWTVKAKCYGDIVHGCTPALEAAGFPVDRFGESGSIGGIRRAVEAASNEIERLTSGIHEVACIVECRLGMINVDRHDGRWYVYNEHGECNDDRHADSLLELVRKLGESAK